MPTDDIARPLPVVLKDERGDVLWTGTMGDFMDANESDLAPEEMADIARLAEELLVGVWLGGGAHPYVRLERVRS